VSATKTPAIEFDGRLFWWIDRAPFAGDQADLCCAPDCTEPISDDEIPLILWSQDGRKMARLHFACAERIGLLRSVRR
jgi:hypothetical protein